MIGSLKLVNIEKRVCDKKKSQTNRYVFTYIEGDKKTASLRLLYVLVSIFGNIDAPKYSH